MRLIVLQILLTASERYTAQVATLQEPGTGPKFSQVPCLHAEDRAMPRAPRLEFDGGLYHLMARGNRRQEIFHDDDDRRRFMGRLSTMIGRTDVELYAFVLMPNHVHLVARRRHTPINRFMRDLLSPYARYVNRRYGASGHLFQGRYRGLVCDDNSYLLRLVRYVHLNPLRGGLCQGVPYPWSSYPLYLQPDSAPWLRVEPVLELFGRTVEEAYEGFRMFHEGPDSMEPSEIFVEGFKGTLGDDGFVARAYRRAARTRPNFGTQRKPLDEILSEALETSGHLVEPVEVRGPGRRRAASAARLAFVDLAVRIYGYSYVEVGGYLRRPPSTLRIMVFRQRRRA
jgi:REP element-mobilizing transposase RayT